MCRFCKQYEGRFIITAPISDTEQHVWKKYGRDWFHFWHRYFKWDWQPAKDAKGNFKMSS